MKGTIHRDSKRRQRKKETPPENRERPTNVKSGIRVRYAPHVYVCVQVFVRVRPRTQRVGGRAHARQHTHGPACMFVWVARKARARTQRVGGRAHAHHALTRTQTHTHTRAGTQKEKEKAEKETPTEGEDIRQTWRAASFSSSRQGVSETGP